MIYTGKFKNLLKPDFSHDVNLLPGSSVNISFSVVNALKTLKSFLDATGNNNFRKNAKAMITKIVKELLDSSPLR